MPLPLPLPLRLQLRLRSRHHRPAALLAAVLLILLASVSSAAVHAADAASGAPLVSPPAAAAPPVAPPAVRTAACPAAEKVGQAELLGRWEVRFANRPDRGTVDFVVHPDFDGAVRGTVAYGDASGTVAGDVDEGVFAVDASSDGKNLTALWEGHVTAGSCGRKIEGIWTDSATNSKRPFVLQRPAAAR
ncbi:hypothetical protein [Xylophilus ampelinus]|uniref:Uncharacterized protein n=1 Tax=Xylophilus ampelinus TaxID=54067 RepID=A0A318SEP8_9BURK|nr:hypothetical protein [Xylophilus ampelinus]MCS4511245.1 hypothetical protein [Xylophilus ampelinus]PYE74999.1 hypothetical protein DFQ15_12120 [Xylophilus ampelinus]